MRRRFLKRSKPRKVQVKVSEPRMPRMMCDACHLAWATHTATHVGKAITLVFCFYHFRKNESALQEQGYEFGEAK